MRVTKLPSTYTVWQPALFRFSNAALSPAISRCLQAPSPNLPANSSHEARWTPGGRSPASSNWSITTQQCHCVGVVPTTGVPPSSPCDTASDFLDREIFQQTLGPGCRSPLYRTNPEANREYPEGQHIFFYYLNTGQEIARVEVPQWVAQDPELLALGHGMMVQQCQQGAGLPGGHLGGPRAGGDQRSWAGVCSSRWSSRPWNVGGWPPARRRTNVPRAARGCNARGA